MSESGHVSVMLDEVLEYLPLKPGAVVVDGTLGLAGHAIEMGKKVSPGGMLIGLDWDEAMLLRAEAKLQELAGVDIHLFRTDYRDLSGRLASACAGAGRDPVADAVLLDLGLNNAQIMDSERGISFQLDGPLDMRMDRSKGKPVSELLAKMSVSAIEEILLEYGGENWARKIAQIIVDRRKTKPLETTFDLVDCVMAAIPAAKRDRRIHPATRTFQAFRIYVNEELDGLQEAVSDAAEVLASDGVIVVLSYHSGEDRAVKNAFRDLAKTKAFEVLTKKPLVPSAAEVSRNLKSRSAKFRALRRISQEKIA